MLVNRQGERPSTYSVVPCWKDAGVPHGLDEISTSRGSFYGLVLPIFRAHFRSMILHRTCCAVLKP